MAALRVAFLLDLSGPAEWIESGYFLRFGGKYVVRCVLCSVYR